MKRPVSTITIIPQRIREDHYRVASFTRQKIYDLLYNYELHKWVCNCPDTSINKNPRCKHCTLLITWIAAQEQQQLAQRQATQIAASLEPSPLESALTQALQRIEALESQTAQRDAEIEALHSRLALLQRDEQESKGTTRDFIALRRTQQEQSRQIAEQDELIRILQQQQCKTNEHRFLLEAELTQTRPQIESLKLATQQQAEINQEIIRQLEQATDQIAELQKLEQKPASIEIKINGKSIKNTGTSKQPKRTRAAKQPKLPEPAQRIQEVRRAGKLVALKIEDATIKIVEGCFVGACNCKDAQKGLTCLHERRAWSYLKEL